MRAYSKIYHAKPENKERHRIYLRSEKRKKKPPSVCETARKFVSTFNTPEGILRSLLYRARKRAKSRNRPCAITIADIAAVWPADGLCPVLGIPLKRTGGKGKGFSCESPSLDEIVIGRGYVRGNIAVISSRANSLKNNGTLEEHERIVAWMFDHALS